MLLLLLLLGVESLVAVGDKGPVEETGADGKGVLTSDVDEEDVNVLVPVMMIRDEEEDCEVEVEGELPAVPELLTELLLVMVDIVRPPDVLWLETMLVPSEVVVVDALDVVEPPLPPSPILRHKRPLQLGARVCEDTPFVFESPLGLMVMLLPPLAEADAPLVEVVTPLVGVHTPLVEVDTPLIEVDIPLVEVVSVVPTPTLRLRQRASRQDTVEETVTAVGVARLIEGAVPEGTNCTNEEDRMVVETVLNEIVVPDGIVLIIVLVVVIAIPLSLFPLTMGGEIDGLVVNRAGEAVLDVGEIAGEEVTLGSNSIQPEPRFRQMLTHRRLEQVVAGYIEELPVAPPEILVNVGDVCGDGPADGAVMNVSLIVLVSEDTEFVVREAGEGTNDVVDVVPVTDARFGRVSEALTQSKSEHPKGRVEIELGALPIPFELGDTANVVEGLRMEGDTVLDRRLVVDAVFGDRLREALTHNVSGHPNETVVLLLDP